MVLLNRIYTRTGDDGTTGLVGGERVGKDDLRIEAYGTVDELNACIGMVRDANTRHQTDAEARSQLDGQLLNIQQRLFDLGASLATRPGSRRPGQPCPTASDIAWLEQTLDAMNAELAPLNSFVLPGGGPIAAPLHLARTVCRRAERATVRLGRHEPVEETDLKYLNRLSDWLFVASRWVAKRLGEPEPLWAPWAEKPSTTK